MATRARDIKGWASFYLFQRRGRINSGAFYVVFEQFHILDIYRREEYNLRMYSIVVLCARYTTLNWTFYWYCYQEY